MVLLIMLSCHSWLGPGILCSWAVGCVLVFRWHCACIEIRSLVRARDDGVVGTCGVLWVFTVFLTEEHV